MAGTTVNSLGHSAAAKDAVRQQFNLLVDDVGAAFTRFFNRAYSAAGTARGTTATKAKTVNAIQFSIDGNLYTKAATDDFWTMSGVDVTTLNFQKYLLLIDAAGAASVLEGTQAASAAAVVLPALPAAKAVVGVVTVQNGAGTSWVPGTTAFNGASVTSTFVDGLPAAVSQLLAAKVNK